LNDFYGKLQEFAMCHQNEAAFDVLRMNMSSLWMLTQAFCAIKAGWGFQLNEDVTGKLCGRALISFLGHFNSQTQ
jgi:hypothetical protein